MTISQIITRLLIIILVSVIALISVALIRTIVFFPFPKQLESCTETHNPIGGQPVIDRFRSALKFKTITYGIQNTDILENKKYIDFIIKSNVESTNPLFKLTDKFPNRLSDNSFFAIRFIHFSQQLQSSIHHSWQ